MNANLRRLVKPHGEAQGFTLVELAIVLIIVSFLFVFLVPLTSGMLNQQKRELTRQKMKNIETAIANYVAVNKRLPCPADGTLTSGTVNAGVEGARTSGDCTNLQVTGVVPWVTIGLSVSDIEDGWSRRVTYRAAYGLTRDSALDMSLCDSAGSKVTDTTGTTPPPGGKCSSTCLVGTDVITNCTSPQNYLANKGFVVRDGAGTTLVLDPAKYTGAAYVIISHGENGYGAYDFGGTYLTTASTGVAGTIEAFNINGPAVSVTSTVPTSANAFRDTDFSDGAAAVYFDDLLIRPSVFSVIQRVQLGPRSH